MKCPFCKSKEIGDLYIKDSTGELKTPYKVCSNCLAYGDEYEFKRDGDR